MKYLFFLMSLLPQLVVAQSEHLEAFDNLIGKTWVADGKWGNGSRFYQEIDYAYSLDSAIIIANSLGFVDQEQTKLGARNHGIRRYDAQSGKIMFWEFDVFGGLTEGTITIDGNNIRYQYDYGGTMVTDLWEYVDEDTYNFKVGSYGEEGWKQLYLETQFRAKKELSVQEGFSMIKQNLQGHWSSTAWDGTLNENWYLDNKGDLNQTAQYIEDNEVLYEASNKIEVVNNELILFSVIKDSNPKIFKATSVESDKITFENTDYSNPNKVIYQFVSNEEFHRSISGTENDQPSSYTFKFKKAH